MNRVKERLLLDALERLAGIVRNGTESDDEQFALGIKQIAKVGQHPSAKQTCHAKAQKLYETALPSIKSIQVSRWTFIKARATRGVTTQRIAKLLDDCKDRRKFSLNTPALTQVLGDVDGWDM